MAKYKTWKAVCPKCSKEHTDLNTLCKNCGKDFYKFKTIDRGYGPVQVNTCPHCQDSNHDYICECGANYYKQVKIDELSNPARFVIVFGLMFGFLGLMFLLM